MAVHGKLKPRRFGGPSAVAGGSKTGGGGPYVEPAFWHHTAHPGPGGRGPGDLGKGFRGAAAELGLPAPFGRTLGDVPNRETDKLV